MAIVSCVLEQDIGDLGSKDQHVKLDADLLKQLAKLGLAREATQEDLDKAGGEDEEPEDNMEPEEDEDDPAAVENQVERITRNANAAVTKSVAKAVEKLTSKVSRPSTQSYHVAGSDELRTGGFKSLGEASMAYINKSRGDFNASKKFSRYGNMAEARAKATGMSIAGSHVGSDLVPQEWADQIFRLMFDKVPNLLELMTKYEMRNQIENVPTLVQATAISGVTGAIVAESTTASPGTITASVQPTQNVQLNLTKLAALVNLSDELLRFNSYNLESVIKQVVPERLRYYLNEYIINGGGGNHLNLAANASTVYVGRQTANQINPTDIYNMEASLWDTYSEDAYWLVTPRTAAALSMMGFPTNASSTAFPVFTGGSFGSNLAEKPLQTLLGKPVLKIENCPALGTTGDIILWHPKSCASGYSGLIADATPYLYFNIAVDSFRFMLYSSSVNPLYTPYTRKDGSFASNIVALSSSSVGSI